MLKGNGFQVFDLGKDVPVANYVAKAKEVNADVVGISALMSTTTPGQRKVIELAKEEGIYGKVRFIVGGACTTPEWAEKIGASYATNAAEAVRVIQSLIKEV
jgi:dimethylamine corrinoid protein